MADEINITAGIRLTKGFLTLAEEPGGQDIDMAGTRYSAGVQDIGTGAHELLATGADFGTAGWAFFQNLDALNFVEFGLDSAGTFVPFAKALTGEFFVVPLTTKNIYAKANTATVKVKFVLVER